MSENLENQKNIMKLNNSKELSNQDIQINNNSIILKKYQTFLIYNYVFVVGIVNKDNLYFECRIKDKYYKKIISKEKIILLNEIFQAYKNITDIYELIILSMNSNKITLEIIKNNKIKLIISIKNENNTPSPFEIILVADEKNETNEEENETANKTKKKINPYEEYTLFKDSENDNDINSNNSNNKNEEGNDNNNDNNQILFSEDESQDIVNDNVMSDDEHKNNNGNSSKNIHNNEFNIIKEEVTNDIKNDEPNNDNNKDINIAEQSIENEEEEEEEIDEVTEENYNEDNLNDNNEKDGNVNNNENVNTEDNNDNNNISDNSKDNNNNIKNTENIINKNIDLNQIKFNKMFNFINELREDIINLKSSKEKDEEIKKVNDEEIKELQIKNRELMEEINYIKNKLDLLFEENAQNKEEIIYLKSFIENKTPNKEIHNIKEIRDLGFNSEEDNTLKNIIQMNEKTLINSKGTIKEDTILRKKKSSKKRNKSKSTKPKRRRKSVLFDLYSDVDSFSNKTCIGVFLFKQKFNVKENEIELDFTNKKIGDKGLENLCQIDFNDLKFLSLDTNGIFNINPLKNLYLNNLEVLNLDNNNISDISILEYVKFPTLQILWLNNNNISDISVFERTKFNQLIHLYLNNNNISDISPFRRTFLRNLERLYLKNNRIEDISCILDYEFDKLNLVYLNRNRINLNLNENKNIIKSLKKRIKYFSY